MIDLLPRFKIVTRAENFLGFYPSDALKKPGAKLDSVLRLLSADIEQKLVLTVTNNNVPANITCNILLYDELKYFSSIQSVC